MADREKIIKGLECIAQKREPTANPCKDCGYSSRLNYAICVKDIASDVLTLLKEQDNCENCAIAIEDRQPVVRCRDCKHGEKVPTFKYYPDVTWCNKYLTSHNDNWFCADGERE